MKARDNSTHGRFLISSHCFQLLSGIRKITSKNAHVSCTGTASATTAFVLIHCNYKHTTYPHIEFSSPPARAKIHFPRSATPLKSHHDCHAADPPCFQTVEAKPSPLLFVNQTSPAYKASTITAPPLASSSPRQHRPVLPQFAQQQATARGVYGSSAQATHEARQRNTSGQLEKKEQDVQVEK